MLKEQEIPQVPLAFIGGSGTFSLDLPEDLGLPGVEVLGRELVYSTPFGPSPPFKLFSLPTTPPRLVLTVKMHGRMPGIPWGEASRRLFWVLNKAGVKKVIAEGGVGSINPLLDPLDIVIPTDYIDFSLRRHITLSEDYLLIMRQPLCPSLRFTLLRVAKEMPLNRVFGRGVYLVTEGRHFESEAEIRVFRQWGADIVGQTLCPEVYLAREIGACYAGIYLVVNYAEGVVKPWEHKVLKDIFFKQAEPFARIIFRALAEAPLEDTCECQNLRKETLLRPENIGRGRPK
ncbi:5'-methylthioadenosine phosphorylase [Thermanaeromonas toyohensis ToBE]|uniref:5'-methylthioadenosine phosphorylase n=1 Tax=Thermanaeromonas toyohensis ToBE TaxID=698762 RepID=A0A1W1VZH0_9FIRM|nr:MTAP family purine nucleoside phosphorylase [Thermanaeromonas toyohensis]SMB98254.1 5'-methylthioadenosine phosphorylase [Thermanaeromonas toyohensis ToBE]